MNLKFLVPCVIPLLAVGAAHAGSAPVAGGVGGGTIQGTTTSASSQRTSIYGSSTPGTATYVLPLGQLSQRAQEALASDEPVTSTLPVGGGNTITVTVTNLLPGSSVTVTLESGAAN